MDNTEKIISSFPNLFSQSDIDQISISTDPCTQLINPVSYSNENQTHSSLVIRSLPTR